MDLRQLRHRSKFLSLVLRHKSEEINLTMDQHGWVSINELLEACEIKGIKLNDNLNEIVEKNDKKRFIISEDGTRIRTNQGHSIKVDLELKEVEPPELLYHGTIRNVVDKILNDDVYGSCLY